MATFSNQAKAILHDWSNRCTMANEHMFAAQIHAAAEATMSLGVLDRLMTYIQIHKPEGRDVIQAEIEKHYRIKPGPGGVELQIKR